MKAKRCSICGKEGTRRTLFRHYHSSPWLCKDERGCYSRHHLAWASENFAEQDKARFMAAVERRKAEIRAELAARKVTGYE